MLCAVMNGKKELEQRVILLEILIDEKNKSLSQSQQVIPIKNIGKICDHKRGHPAWLLCMYEW